ncbi:hypothetical protein ACERNI_17730 [Camelimonas sp. ID_303_24]
MEFYASDSSVREIASGLSMIRAGMEALGQQAEQALAKLPATVRQFVGDSATRIDAHDRTLQGVADAMVDDLVARGEIPKDKREVVLAFAFRKNQVKQSILISQVIFQGTRCIKMNDEPINKYYGTPMSEWIEGIPLDLEDDVVMMVEIFPRGRDSFGLAGEELENFGYRCILKLLEAGASPVWPSGGDEGVIVDTKYQGTSEQIARQIVDEWKRGDMRENYDGLWFSLPPFDSPTTKIDSK